MTNELIHEEEDYLDFDNILDNTDEEYVDYIDAIETNDSGKGSATEDTDPQAKRLQLLKLFQGKTRLQRLSIVNADFAFNFYRSLKTAINSSENVLLAPVGISTTLSMMSLGLKGNTWQQVLDVLGFQDFVNSSTKYEVITIHKLFQKLTHRLFRRKFGYTLRSVNDLYVQQNYNILDSYKNSTKNYYFAEAQSVDFSNPAFITTANKRIMKLTKGLIKEALKTVNPFTVMMLLNCLYFKGSWENKFPVAQTHIRSFRLNDKQTVKVPMMQTKGNFLAAADHELECDILQLPYVGNISMMIAIPRKLSGMQQLEKKLEPAVVEKWVKAMTNRTREVILPKFKLERSYDLKAYLEGMGLTNIFSNHGDFSGISDEQLLINLFNHQGTITVNEEGTEAAAVTTVGFMPLSTQIRFVADRPFMFFIYEHRTNCLLFMGRVSNPAIM